MRCQGAHCPPAAADAQLRLMQASLAASRPHAPRRPGAAQPAAGAAAQQGGGSEEEGGSAAWGALELFRQRKYYFPLAVGCSLMLFQQVRAQRVGVASWRGGGAQGAHKPTTGRVGVCRGPRAPPSRRRRRWPRASWRAAAPVHVIRSLACVRAGRADACARAHSGVARVFVAIARLRVCAQVTGQPSVLYRAASILQDAGFEPGKGAASEPVVLPRMRWTAPLWPNCQAAPSLLRAPARVARCPAPMRACACGAAQAWPCCWGPSSCS